MHIGPNLQQGADAGDGEGEPFDPSGGIKDEIDNNGAFRQDDLGSQASLDDLCLSHLHS